MTQLQQSIHALDVKLKKWREQQSEEMKKMTNIEKEMKQSLNELKSVQNSLHTMFLDLMLDSNHIVE